MSVLKLVCYSVLAFTFAASAGHAAQLDDHQLQQITEAAASICNTVKEAKGKKDDVQIQGDVKAQLGGLARRLGADAEVSGKGVVNRSEFEGLTQEATVIALGDDRGCRERLFNKMFDAATTAPANTGLPKVGGGEGRARDVVPQYENQFLHARLIQSGAQPRSATISVEIRNTTSRPIRLGFIRSYNESVLNTAQGIQCQMNGSAGGLPNLLIDEIQHIQPSALSTLGPSKTQVISYSFGCSTALQDTSATLISKMVGQVDGSLESFSLALPGIPIALGRSK